MKPLKLSRPYNLKIQTMFILWLIKAEELYNAIQTWWIQCLDIGYTEKMLVFLKIQLSSSRSLVQNKKTVGVFVIIHTQNSQQS